MNRLIKRLSVLILLIFSVSAQVWAGTYYAKMTATLSSQSPSGSGLVYVNTEEDPGSDEDYKVTSEIVGSLDITIGSSAAVPFFLYARPERGYYFQGWSNDIDGEYNATFNPWNATINSNSTNSTNPSATDTKYAIFKLRPLPTEISVSPAAITMLEGEDRMVTYTLPNVPNLFNCVEASATSGGGFINIPTTLVEKEGNTGTFTISGVSAGSSVVRLSAKDKDGNVQCYCEVSITVRAKCKTPVISFTDNGSNGTTTITCATPGATIYYTTNGSEPSNTSTVYSGPFDVAENTTVKAIAYGSGSMEESDVATNTFSHNSGVFGQMVVLNDYEDHNWAYYKGRDIKVGTADDAPDYKDKYKYTLYSPDPRNVKITYRGFNTDANTIILGSNTVATSTLNDNTTPHVSNATGEGQNTFVYYKTLEKFVIGYFTDNADWNGIPDDPTKENYPYTIISNPFSVRPSTGSGTKTYYGFAGWKIVRGGKFIGRGDYPYTAASDGDVLGLDELIHFVNLDSDVAYTPNCTSAEIVLEATWVEATVWSGNTAHTFSGGTYETNFIVASGNITTQINQSSPCTIIGMYPDGTGDNSGSRTITGLKVTTTSTTDPYDRSNCVKVEWIRHGNGTFDANGRNLTMGRGIISSSGSGNTAQGNVYGNNTNGQNVVNTVKVESGYYSKIANLNTTTATATNVINSYVIMGCDYDRALANYYVPANEINNNAYNIKLRASRIYGPNGNPDLHRANGQLYLRSLIKSGVFASEIGNEYYFHAYQRPGQRYIEMEGGYNKGHIKGGSDGSTSQGRVRAMSIRMKGGRIDGQIACGSTSTFCSGDRLVVITGGRIGGWIAPGSNCSSTGTGNTGKTDGSSYVYFGGTAEINSRQFETEPSMMSQSTGGVIYGAGLGYNPNDNTGEMTKGSNIVFADDAYTERGIYGGGAIGQTLTTANIFILGGRIGTGEGQVQVQGTGSSTYNVKAGVYGGACDRGGENSFIYMDGGIVESGIYGGANINGTMTGNVTMQIIGGQIGTSTVSANAHGGGYGQNTIVTGNVDITLGDSNGNKPTVYGDVYGGSGLGKVNGTASDASKHTNVTVNNAEIHGDLYGGGLGNGDYAADVYGVVAVSFKDGSVNNVFGCNNANGRPYNGVSVGISGGTINNNVYGGGNAAAYTGSPTVTISGGEVKENVFGAGLGSSAAVTGNTSVTITDAATKIGGSVYGGGEAGDVTGNAVVSLTDATVGGSIYGAGLGEPTEVGGNTAVSVLGQANVTGNIYGGGESGDVTGGTTVTVNGNLQVNNVYGAGKGEDSNVGTSTSVTLTAGTVNGSVYGGAEKGTVRLDGSGNAADVATVTIANGLVKGNVYGGGQLGTVAGQTTVNMNGGTVEGNLFGGALGTKSVLYVGGLKTINMTGGTVVGDLYGGSQNANDANSLTPAESDKTATVFVNISGGRVVKNVYGGGFFGNIYGDVTVNVGKNAIENAPGKESNVNMLTDLTVAPIKLEGSVYAGSDWGEFSAGSDFGECNIDGHSDIYVDGTGYNMEQELIGNYMIISGSIYGAGTSSDAGDEGRRVYIRNYGNSVVEDDEFKSCTRSLYSIQRADEVYLENSHINFIGQGDMTSFITTERYSIINVFEDLRLIKGSSVIVNSPIHKVKKLQSLALASGDIYTANDSDYSAVNYNGLSACDNKFRVNAGGYINVKYPNDWSNSSSSMYYGELNGFFHMQTSAQSSFAYARPKSAGSSSCPADYSNPNDGGFVCYDATRNTYDIDGNLVESGVQVPFTNQTPDGKHDVQYYRFWKFVVPGGENYREGVLVAKTKHSSDQYLTAECTVELPASTSCYFKVSSIDWGMDVACIDAAITKKDGTTWSYWNDEEYGSVASNTLYEGINMSDSGDLQDLVSDQLELLDAAPNTVFGLTVAPAGSLENVISEVNASGEVLGTKSALVISGNTSTEHLASRRFYVDASHLTETPKLTFTLTYSNELDRNTVLSSVVITFEEYSCGVDGNPDVLVTTTDVELVVNTETVIDQDFSVPGYALMYGKGQNGDVYNTKVVLPTFQMLPGSTDSRFTITNIQADFSHAQTDAPVELRSAEWFDGNEGGQNNIAITYGASLTYDNVQGWLTGYDLNNPEASLHDVKEFNPAHPVELGTVDGRQHFGVALNLYYDGSENISPEDHYMGTVTFTVKFTNYEKDEYDQPKDSYFDIVLDITARGAAINWYVDGVNGQNLYSGKFPNKAKKSLSGVFNSSSFAPSDNIFIVNTVSINDSHGTEWSGLQYGSNNVYVYRYPGGHQEEGNMTGDGVLPQFTGTMVSVNRDFVMRGITLDGMNEWDGKYHELLNPDYYETLGADEHHGFDVTPTAPIIEINNGAKVTFYKSSVSNNHNNSGNGGGIRINDGVLTLNGDCNITGNLVNNGLEGGGVFVSENGTLNVNGEVRIDGNMANGISNNVYLPTVNQKININGGLTGNSHIGVTKTAFPENSGFTPIAFSETVDQAAEAYRRGYFFDDKGMYAVVYDPSNPVLGPNTLYFGETWVTHRNSEPAGFSLDNVNSDEDLAWVISLVNGFNGQEPQSDLNVTITEDLDMGNYIWVPIGNSTHKFSGVFDGGGHQINNLVCSMSGLGAVGLLGYVDGENAEVKNVFAMDASVEAPDQNYMGSIAGVVSGGATVHSCEGALDLRTGNVNTVMGGLVGLLDGGNIHSCISTANLNGYLMGGLVGQTRNGASIKNSYAYAGITYKGTGGHHIAGMVADNAGTVESCYIRLRDSYDMNDGKGTFYILADNNSGALSQCYYANGADNDLSLYHTGNAPSNCDVYFPGTHPYTYNENYNRVGNKTTGDYLLTKLNAYAKTNGMDTWFRSASDLNEDLPLLRFPNLASVSNVAGSPKFYYLNSLQAAFDKFGTETTNNVYVDVYGNSNVETTSSNTGSSKIKLAINEDAAVLQSDGSTLVASVGITLDNSAGEDGANPNNGAPDEIDWHMFSSALQHAPLGINYTDNDQHDWWTQGHHADYSFYPDNSSYSGYFPGNTPVAKYDFYCYYEPQYHWINFKRNGNSHWHEDPNEENQHEWIDYKYTPNGGSLVHGSASNNEAEFICGKGYLLSVNDETFLQATGTLNNGTVTYSDVTYTEAAHCPGLNLIGNPYQSYLDFDEFADVNSISSYSILDEDKGGYVPYAVESSTNSLTASRYIHMHQGFFVVTNENKTITFTNDMRSATAADVSFRGNERPAYPLVNLILTEASGNKDYAIVELGRPDVGGAKKIETLRSGHAQVYIHYDNEDYSLAFTESGISSVPVRFRTDADGVFTLKWGTENGTFDYLHLIDNMTGVDVDCLTADEYVFNATTDDYESRFKLVFQYTGVEENGAASTSSASFAFFNGGDLVVNGEGRIECVDLQGRRLFVTDVYGTQNHVTLPDYASGLYLLHLSNGKQTKVQKIVVK